MSPIPKNDPAPLEGLVVAFVGKLGGLTRREAQQLVRRHGGRVADKADASAKLIVVGADELPLGAEELLSDEIVQAAETGRLEILSETQFCQRLGLDEAERDARRLFTPAMLADLLKIPVATVRGWHRRGLITPVRVVHRLPYFDFQEVQSARSLAQLLAAGMSPAAIERKLHELRRWVPDVARPLAQLSVIVEGHELLLRQGEGLIDSRGQMRFDFEAEPPPSAVNASVESTEAPSTPTADDLASQAIALDEQGNLSGAVDLLRAALAAGGPRADWCFQLAELLYRQGEIAAARERYFMAIELDEDYVEARANLGCVLAEHGEHELAVAAFEGALLRHQDYADVHYHSARSLDELGQAERAAEHWRTFLALAPESPWAAEAIARLETF